MPKKPLLDGGTRIRMINVGSRMLFENGFDALSIRAIMNAVGANAGTFYYYFNSKAEFIEEILNGFFKPYCCDMEDIVRDARAVPYNALHRFFMYEQSCVREFRIKHGRNIHFSVKLAIRDRALDVMLPYMEQIICILTEYGAKPSMDAHTMAIFLAHGVGNCILHEQSDWVDSAKDMLNSTVNMIMGIDEQVLENMRAVGADEATEKD